MKRALRWFSFLALLALTAVLLRWWFPGDETRIRQLIAQVAKAASVTGNEGDLGRTIKAAELASHCTADIAIRVTALGLHGSLDGRDNVRSAALQLGNTFGNYRVVPEEVVIRERSPDQARVSLTAAFEGLANSELNAQEFELILRKQEGRWRIARIQTVSALRR